MLYTHSFFSKRGVSEHSAWLSMLDMLREALLVYIWMQSDTFHASCCMLLLLLVAAGLPVEPTVTPSTSGASLPAAMQIRSRVRWFSPIFTFLLAFFFLDLHSRRLFVRSYRTAIWRKYGTGNVAREVSPLPSQVSF